jgi:hypothetical protein
MKINPGGAELFQANGQTDIKKKSNSRFSQLCEKRLEILKPQNDLPKTPCLALTHNYKTTI